MDTKRCMGCKEVKPLDKYSKNKSTKDGLQQYCKECNHKYYLDNAERIRARSREYKETYPDEVRARSLAYYQKHGHDIRSRIRAYYAEHPEEMRTRKRNDYHKHRDKRAAYREEYKKRYPLRERATDIVEYAIHTGDIIRPSICSCCGLTCKPDAHHEDYSKPLEVDWLCRSCHRKLSTNYIPAS